MQELSEFENAFVGAVGGAIEVSVNQPTVTWKNQAQQGKSLSLNPRIAYRGYASNVMNMGTATMVQFTVNGSMKRWFTGGKRDLTTGEEMTSAFVAGFTSGIFCNPLELTMIQQQNQGGSFVGTMARLWRHAPSTLLRGVSTTCTREGVYTAGYLGVTPVVSKFLQTNFKDGIGASEYGSRFIGAIAGACFGALLSHPVDTIKTLLQSDIERKKYTRPRQAIATVFKEQGIRGFYRGAFWRFSRQVVGVLILDQARLGLSPLLFPDAFNKADLLEE